MKRNKADSQAESQKPLRVVLSRSGSQWQARAGELSVRGHNTRTVRRLVTAMIVARYGRAAFEIVIELPKDQTALVRSYRDDERQLRTLADSVPSSRLHCIRELLAMNLSQAEVAELLGMTRSHLAVALKRAQAPASARPPTGRRRT